MRIIAYLTAFVFLVVNANAATSITTPSVSGHWTLAGSPYNVHNDIQVDAGTSLVIDPGVQVVFFGAYRLQVQGMLHAAGDSANQIYFTVADTTGFSTDLVTHAGGWHGIQIRAYAGSAPDSSIVRYCNVSYFKVDSLDYWLSPYPMAFDVERSLRVENCNFFNNRANPNCNIPIAAFRSGWGDTIEITGCSFFNNRTINAVVRSYNAGSSLVHFNNNKIHDNAGNGGSIYCAGENLLFENNDVYKNTTGITISGAIGAITLYVSAATIMGNKFHENTSWGDAAIYSGGGVVDIIGNLICNNQHMTGSCGAVDGGGALNLGNNSSIPPTSTVYNVRNNIIANNYSPFHGGAINVYFAKINISNNQFINNSSQDGAAIYVDDTFDIVVRNNIFYGDTITNPGSPYISPAVCGTQNGHIQYDHNWQQGSTLSNLHLGGIFTMSGDSTTNIIGTVPGLVAPTTTSSVSEMATSGDFSLMTISPCIDKGDTVGLICDSFDYVGNSRIYGSHIDIGAFEYHPVTTAIQNLSATSVRLNVYPNPATNTVFISTTSADGMLYLQDISGRTILEQKITNTVTSIDIHSIPCGIYIAAWISGTGGTHVQKIVVQ